MGTFGSILVKFEDGSLIEAYNNNSGKLIPVIGCIGDHRGEIIYVCRNTISFIIEMDEETALKDIAEHNRQYKNDKMMRAKAESMLEKLREL